MKRNKPDWIANWLNGNELLEDEDEEDDPNFLSQEEDNIEESEKEDETTDNEENEVPPSEEDEDLELQEDLLNITDNFFNENFVILPNFSNIQNMEQLNTQYPTSTNQNNEEIFPPPNPLFTDQQLHRLRHQCDRHFQLLIQLYLNSSTSLEGKKDLAPSIWTLICQLFHFREEIFRRKKSKLEKPQDFNNNQNNFSSNNQNNYYNNNLNDLNYQNDLNNNQNNLNNNFPENNFNNNNGNIQNLNHSLIQSNVNESDANLFQNYNVNFQQNFNNNNNNFISYPTNSFPPQEQFNISYQTLQLSQELINQRNQIRDPILNQNASPLNQNTPTLNQNISPLNQNSSSLNQKKSALLDQGNLVLLDQGNQKLNENQIDLSLSTIKSIRLWPRWYIVELPKINNLPKIQHLPNQNLPITSQEYKKLLQTFQFEEKYLYTPTKVSARIKFLDSEDALLVRGVERYTEEKKQKNVAIYSVDCIEQIQKFLLPTKTSSQITNRLRTQTRGAKENPLRKISQDVKKFKSEKNEHQN